MSRFAGIRGRRRALLVAAVVVAVFASAFAIAASLIVNDDTLGAGTSVVATCDTDGIKTTWAPGYQAAAPGPGFVVSSVKITGINVTPLTGCLGKDIKVQLTDASSAVLTDGSGTLTGIDAATETVSLAGPVSAAAVEKVYVTIYGP